MVFSFSKRASLCSLIIVAAISISIEVFASEHEHRTPRLLDGSSNVRKRTKSQSEQPRLSFDALMLQSVESYDSGGFGKWGFVAYFRDQYLNNGEMESVHGLALSSLQPHVQLIFERFSSVGELTTPQVALALNSYFGMKNVFKLLHQWTSIYGTQTYTGKSKDATYREAFYRGISDLYYVVTPFSSANQEIAARITQFYLNITNAPLGVSWLLARLAFGYANLPVEAKYEIIERLEMRGLNKLYRAGVRGTQGGITKSEYESFVSALQRVIATKKQTAKLAARVAKGGKKHE